MAFDPIIGSKEDIKSRLQAYTPLGWYWEDAVVYPAVLDGFSTAYAFNYSQFAFTEKQIRLATATGFLLDLAAEDFFGGFLKRGANPKQSDEAFRTTILANLLREKATRNGLKRLVTDLTGYEPIMFEPWNPLDVGGGYDSESIGFTFDIAGYWGGEPNYTGYIVVFLAPIHFKELIGFDADNFGFDMDPEADLNLWSAYLSVEAFDALLKESDIIRWINLTKCYGTRVLVEFREAQNG